MATKKFKFDITKYNFADLAELLNYVEKIWVKELKLENQVYDCDWDLSDLYFQGIDFSKSNENYVCVKFLIHDWNSPYEKDMDISVKALTDWESYKKEIIEEVSLEKEREAEKLRKKEEERLKREAKKKEKEEKEAAENLERTERAELARLKEKYEN